MSSSEFLSPAPKGYIWPQCPEADRFIQSRLAAFTKNHSFARLLASRMREETSTEFQAWVDHIVISAKEFSPAVLAKIGYVPDNAAKSPAGSKLFWHPFADLPRLLLVSKSPCLSVAVMVDSIRDFQLTHGLSLPIEGEPLSQFRISRLSDSRALPGTNDLLIIERRGTRSVVPDTKNKTSLYYRAVENWTNRRRRFPSQKQALAHAQNMAQKMVKQLGTGLAAAAFLEAERRYWQAKNRAGQVQKARQDRLGLGWSNHDHHTFRSGRAAFTGLIKILLTFGFKKRERYYAGAEAGWGAQVMEQPECKFIIFADVDLSPNEVTVDFSRKPLPELKKPGTVGLWCALHGESILEAGMHHLEAKFDFEHLRVSMINIGVNFMKPFSDFPHLRQAFSEGELWRVPEERLLSLKSEGKLSEEAFERIRVNGAVGSHLENLQRRNGFKGFNQRGVSDIIKAVNPELQALKRNGGTGA